MMRLRLAGVAFACALALAGTVVGVATADPSNGSDPLLYEFTNCTDGIELRGDQATQRGCGALPDRREAAGSSSPWLRSVTVTSSRQMGPSSRKAPCSSRRQGSRARTIFRRSPARTSRRCRRPGRGSPDTSRGRSRSFKGVRSVRPVAPPCKCAITERRAPGRWRAGG